MLDDAHPAPVGSEESTAALSLGGKVSLFVLQEIEAGKRLGSIADELRERFPEYEADPERAFSLVVGMARRFSEPTEGAQLEFEHCKPV